MSCRYTQIEYLDLEINLEKFIKKKKGSHIRIQLNSMQFWNS